MLKTYKLFLFILLSFAIATSLANAALDDPINTLPTSNASFLADLQTYLLNETGDRFFQQIGTTIISGGEEASRSSFGHNVTACVGYPEGHYVSQAQVAHTYTASKDTYVFLRDSNTRSIAIGAAVVTYDGFFTFVEMSNGVAQPLVPVGITSLMKVVTDGSGITGVTDLRSGSVSVVHFGTLATAATKKNRTIVLNEGMQIITGSVTLSATSTLVVRANAKINIQNGGTFTIAGRLVYDGPWPFVIDSGGTLAFTSSADLLFYQTGLRLRAIESGETIGDEAGVSYIALDADDNVTSYAELLGRVNSNTAGSEEGALWFGTTKNGTLRLHGHFDDDGALVIGENTTSHGPVVSGVRVEIQGNEVNAEKLLALVNTDTTPVSNATAMELVFAAEDSADNITKYGTIRVVAADVTNGSEQGRFEVRLMDTGGNDINAMAVEGDPGGGQLSNIKHSTEAKTSSPYTVGSSGDSFRIFTNLSAGGAMVFNLPEAAFVGTGYTVGFSVATAQQVTITPFSGDQINRATTSLVNAGVVGSHVVLSIINESGTGHWDIVSMLGTWSKASNPILGAIIPYTRAVTLADDATFNLPDISAGHGIVTAHNSTGGGESMYFAVNVDGAVTKIAGSTNTAATDSDTDLCVFDGGTFATVKNRLGSSRRVTVTFWH